MMGTSGSAAELKLELEDAWLLVPPACLHCSTPGPLTAAWDGGPEAELEEEEEETRGTRPKIGAGAPVRIGAAEPPAADKAG